MCVSALWATLSYAGRDSDPFGPVFLPDSARSVHAAWPEALIPSDHGASSDTVPTNGLLTWLSGLPLTSQRPSISPPSLCRAYYTQTLAEVCLKQSCLKGTNRSVSEANRLISVSDFTLVKF